MKKGKSSKMVLNQLFLIFLGTWSLERPVATKLYLVLDG